MLAALDKSVDMLWDGSMDCAVPEESSHRPQSDIRQSYGSAHSVSTDLGESLNQVVSELKILNQDARDRRSLSNYRCTQSSSGT